MTTIHPDLLATDYAGETPGRYPESRASSERLARAESIADALDASGDYDARVWAKGDQVRVYVRTSAGKDCGQLVVAPDLSIDRRGLSKQAGTITRIAEEVQS